MRREQNRRFCDFCESLMPSRKSAVSQDKKRVPGNSGTLDLTGAGEGIRTSDLLITSQLLYQLSYTGQYAAAVHRAEKHFTLYIIFVKTALIADRCKLKFR